MSLRSHVPTQHDPVLIEEQREKVFDILHRVETHDLQRQQDQSSGDESQDDDENDPEEGISNDSTFVGVSDSDFDAVDTASVQTLLSMLTPKERRAFESATETSSKAQKLMKKLERKADHLNSEAAFPSTLTNSAIESLQTITSNSTHQPGQHIVASALMGTNNGPNTESATKRAWQSQLWFEGPTACPSALRPEFCTTFALEVTKLFASSASSAIAADLTFNLAAVLMAYTYLLRHFDLDCLSRLDADAGSSHASLLSEIFALLDRLVPYLTYKASKAPHSSSRTDRSIVLADLDDSLLSLLSHMSYESELAAGTDQLRLQLLKDLNSLSVRSKIMSIPEPDKQDSRDTISSCFASDRHVFTASQNALVVNAVADLYTFLGLVVTNQACRGLTRAAKSAQKKLCFYLVNTVFKANHTSTAYAQLPELTTAFIHKVEQDMASAQKINKIAIANKLAERGLSGTA